MFDEPKLRGQSSIEGPCARSLIYFRNFRDSGSFSRVSALHSVHPNVEVEMGKSRFGVTETLSAIGNIQRYLDSRNYDMANDLRDQLERKFLVEVLHMSLTKPEMSEISGLILNIDNLAPHKPLAV